MIDFITTYRNECLDKLIDFYIEHEDIKPGYADCAVLASYRFTNEMNQTTFTVERLPSGLDDMGEFMASVEDQSGIREMLVFDESTGLMEGLHYLLMMDWAVIEPVEIKTELYTIRGLRLRKKA